GREGREGLDRLEGKSLSTAHPVLPIPPFLPIPPIARVHISRTRLLDNPEAVQGRKNQREQRRRQAENRVQHVVAALSRQRVEERGRRVAADEAAGVRVVV